MQNATSMTLDDTTRRWLNLLALSPLFVIRLGGANEKATVSNPEVVPNNDGEYWVAGKTTLKCGVDLDSVFLVDTDNGGTLIGVYWQISGIWWDFFDRPAVFKALNKSEAEVFPFDWSFAVDLELDISH